MSEDISHIQARKSVSNNHKLPTYEQFKVIISKLKLISQSYFKDRALDLNRKKFQRNSITPFHSPKPAAQRYTVHFGPHSCVVITLHPKGRSTSVYCWKSSFHLNFLSGHIHMSYFGATGVLDFWWYLLWVSKYVLYDFNVHSPRSTCGATHCQPLDGQHYGMVISDAGPILPPIEALSKPCLNVDHTHSSTLR